MKVCLSILILLQMVCSVSGSFHFLGPQKDPIATSFCPKGSKGFFVLYYGTDFAEMKKIRELQPDFVILGELTEAQLAQGYLQKFYDAFHRQSSAAPVRALIYAHTHRSSSPPEVIDVFVKQALEIGYEGIFFDDVEANAHDYNYDRAALVKRFDKNRLVIMNPGLVISDRKMFEYADIVSVENRWFDKLPMWDGIAPYRWLSVQGDPADQTAPQFQAPKDLKTAMKRLKEFRSGKHESRQGAKGFWYYSSGSHHWELPLFDLKSFRDQIMKLSGPDNVCP